MNESHVLTIFRVRGGVSVKYRNILSYSMSKLIKLESFFKLQVGIQITTFPLRISLRAKGKRFIVVSKNINVQYSENRKT